ncbi:U4/U6-U5 snRNP complex subunit PRP6 KNAG_0H01250 [Huiozyma naganishii CBS 8797]|uniref:PRP1 splicing factor N-terminal domain-containing protein n=1 Tax=Huiozyma naganishii (strain ATCC MYA-139 / BCRC 22969 / CBS 8797 / KCTC 17520 / NBRC 10181 / NCYC 3082 / Yp74L-3) TaxID=1071383 RepID=J7RPD2_HUIN7|nr:hypothetical protein KNAG_0H01250 [Kazachstania naganishii CBS 8797]CCK71538.1 hypothetical protein KNAG_0H01250 [Kazachstania naganishii CBS 8797]
MERPAFLDQSPPPGYIAGIGRGATGFSTRGSKNNAVPKRFKTDRALRETDHTKPDDEDDKEADLLFGSIDAVRNRAPVDEELESGKNRQFKDLKRSLAQVTEDEWLNIPEASDLTRRNKRNRLEEQLNRKTYAGPDSLITKNVNLRMLTETRKEVLGKQLDMNFLNKDTPAVSTSEMGEVAGYLEQLEQVSEIGNITDAQSGDIKKMRIILQSYRKSDPKQPQGWIASARLEMKAKNTQAARKIIQEGCRICPKNEDIWLENINLHNSDFRQCKGLAAQGIQFNPTSFKLWSKAIDLESETINKQRVIRKALQTLPREEQLWKQAVEYEDSPSEIVRIVRKALEFVPQSITLWTLLIESQEYSEAKRSLSKARELVPDSFDIWIIASQVEERQGSVTCAKLEKLLTRGMDDIQRRGISFPYDVWLKRALELETKSNCRTTGNALVNVILTSALKDPSQYDPLTKYVSSMENSFTKIHCYELLLRTRPLKFSVWMAFREVCIELSALEELYGSFETLLFEAGDDYKVLREVPNLALLYAKNVWKLSQDLERAVDIIERARKIIPNTLDLWFAKLKLLSQAGQFDRVVTLFKEMMGGPQKEKFPGFDRMYYKYANFLRFQGKHEEAATLLETKCVPQHPGSYKGYLQLAQICEEINLPDKAREWYTLGREKCPSIVLFPILIAKVDELYLNKIARARSVLETAIVKQPKEELLYQALVQLETRQHNLKAAQLLIARGLRNLPASALLWVERFNLAASKKSSQKKTLFQDALKSTHNNSLIILHIGIRFIETCSTQLL